MNDTSDIPGLPERPNLIKEKRSKGAICCKFFIAFLTIPLIVLVIF